MNEGQGHPVKKWPSRLARTMLWSTLFIGGIAILAYMISFLPKNIIGAQQQTEHHDAIRNKIQQAVDVYIVNHNGSLPTLNGSYTNAECSDCKIINISALLSGNGGALQSVPISLWQGPGTCDDNCDAAGSNISGCFNTSHYVWIVDNSGIVYSTCRGEGCPSNNSGCQNIWP